MHYGEQKHLLSELTIAVATLLNEGEKTVCWRPITEDDGRVSTISGPNESKLYLSLSGRSDRVEISGSLHVGKDGRYVEVYEDVLDKGTGRTHWQRASNPRISVAIARGVQVVAKEIKRRVLPEYTRILALAIAKRNAELAHENASQGNLRTLLQAVGDFRGVKAEEKHRYISSERLSGISGEIKVSGDKVELELSGLSVEQAKTILLAFVKKQ